MGVRLLNTFIKQKCKRLDSVKKISLCELSNKRIAIDTSIYMYRYKAEKNLIIGIYNMCAVLLEYNIIPLFVFDGKPLKEKKEELKKRSKEKNIAENKYNDLKEQLLLDPDNADIKESMIALEKKFIRITYKEIIEVKDIIRGFGIQYIDAVNEADELCAYLSVKKKVFAVLSEDTDMFVYGCPNIIRYFSITNKHCVLYKIKNILKELNMNMLDFKQLCVISGTDYNNKHNKKNIFKYYDKYNDYTKSNYTDLLEYYANTMRLDNVNELKQIFSLYQINNSNIDESICKLKMNTNIIDLELIKKTMSKYNFIFI